MRVIVVAGVVPQRRDTAVTGIAVGSTKGERSRQILCLLSNPINRTLFS